MSWWKALWAAKRSTGRLVAGPRPPPRNPLPCTYVGEHPIDGYSGNEDIWREWTALARPYSGKYDLDGWIVDATPETYFAQHHDAGTWGFSNGSAGSVVVVTRAVPLDPPLADEYLVAFQAWGLTTCPRCAKPLRFLATQEPGYSAGFDIERCDCRGLPTFPDMHICHSNFLSQFTVGFTMSARADKLCGSYHESGPWYLPSVRIDGIRLFDRLDRATRLSGLQESRGLDQRFPPGATPL